MYPFVCTRNLRKLMSLSFFLFLGEGGVALSVKYYVKHSVSSLWLMSVQYTCAPIIWTFCYENGLASFGLESLYLSYIKLFFNVCHFELAMGCFHLIFSLSVIMYGFKNGILLYRCRWNSSYIFEAPGNSENLCDSSYKESSCYSSRDLIRARSPWFVLGCSTRSKLFMEFNTSVSFGWQEAVNIPQQHKEKWKE